MDYSRLQEALSARFLSVDFGPYFAFIESLPQVDEGHRHHTLPQKEFPEFAKDSNNIIRLSPADHFRAHYWLAVCAPQIESFQFVFYLMANRKRVYQIPTNELTHYAEIYERGRMGHIERARALGRSGVGGRIGARRRNELYGNPATPEGRAKAGRKNVESGHVAAMATPEGRSKGGRIGGHKNVESGHIQALGYVQGRKNIETGHIQTLGHTQGRKNVENGHIAKIGTTETRAKGGRTRGRKSAEDGQIQALGRIRGRKNAEDGTLERGRHTRWHVNRGLVSPACGLCFLEETCPSHS